MMHALKGNKSDLNHMR